MKLNFDGITYAKGASALRQLVVWVGEEEFFAGLRAYFASVTSGATPSCSDLLVELEATSGRDLSTWTQQWLRTPGSTSCGPRSSTPTPTRTPPWRSSRSRRDATGLQPMLRSHRLRVGLYDLVDGRLTRTEQLELDVVGARTELPQLAGRRAVGPPADQRRRPDLRQDPPRRTLVGHCDRPHRRPRPPMPRSWCGQRAWDMTRDAEWSTADYLQLALSGCPPNPTSAWSRRCCSRSARQSSCTRSDAIATSTGSDWHWECGAADARRSPGKRPCSSPTRGR